MVSTAPIRRATQQYQQFFPQATAAETGAVNQATGTLTGQAIPALQGAEQQAVGTLQGALPQGISYLQGGYGQAGGDINQALGLYSPLAQTANQAFNMYGQALGLGGPQGNAAAVNAFRTDPGYQFQMQQGLDALQREANSRGLLASGNLTEDELKFSQGLADQGYQQWMQNLWGLGGQAPGLAGAQSGLYQTLANQRIGLGQQEAGMTGQTAGAVAGLQSDLGKNLSNIYGGVARMQQGLGQDVAQNLLGQGQVGYQGAQDIFNVKAQEAANQQNLWANLLGAGAGLAGRVLGGPLGGQIGTAVGGAFA